MRGVITRVTQQNTEQLGKKTEKPRQCFYSGADAALLSVLGRTPRIAELSDAPRFGFVQARRLHYESAKIDRTALESAIRPISGRL